MEKARVISGETFSDGLYQGKPYVSGEQPSGSVVKLNTNENPYPPAPDVRKVISSFDAEKLRLYPRQDGGVLREALARIHGVDTDNVFVGNGSDEVLALAFRACFGLGEDLPVLFSAVTYSFYPVWCEFFKIPYKTIPVRNDFRLNLDDYAVPNGGIVICNPNAPTGISEGEDFLNAVIEANGSNSVIIVDEAYGDFADSSIIDKIHEVPNLLVTRSFSKGRSLAGQRIGYAIGDKNLIDAIMAAKDSFNSYPVDAITTAVGIAALEDEEYYRNTIGKIQKTRDDTSARLVELGFDVPKSSANFVFAGCGSATRAKELFELLREGGIYVRYFDKPGIDDRLRISIGTPEDMDAFFERLEESCSLKI